MVRVSIHGTYLGTLLPAFVLLAVGLGLSFVPATLIGVSSVHGDDAGLASGLFNTAQQVGGALGLAILATLAASRTSSLINSIGHHASKHAVAAATVSGYRIAFLVAAGFMLTAIVVIVSFLRPRHLAHVVLDGELAATSAGA
jgi:hypothetical protein